MGKFIENPCRNCVSRVVGCHGRCKEYLEYFNHNQRVNTQRFIESKSVVIHNIKRRRKI
jgi:hypothetical protein